MFDSQETIEIHRPKEHVFKVAESYPLFVRFFKSREILHQDDRTMRVRIGSTILGLPTSWIGEGKKTRFESIEFLQTQGFFKGLVAKWTFMSLSPSASRVSIQFRFQMTVPVIGGWLERTLVTLKVRPTVKGILAELKRTAESTAPS